jgi:hypothetical protein
MNEGWNMSKRKIELTEIEHKGEIKVAKICTKCEIVKPLEDFSVKKNGTGGRSAVCKQCYKMYYQANKEKIIDNSQKNYDKERKKQSVYKYRENNPEKYKEWQKKAEKKYYHTHKEERSKAHEEWRKNNPEFVKKNQLNWRATQKALPAGLNMEVYNELKKSACFFTCSEKSEIDHFIAVSTGHGGSYKGNLVPVIREINSSKHDKNPFQWLREQNYVFEERFNDLVKKLALENCLTVDEYRNFVYWCYENKRSKKEIMKDERFSIEIWRDVTKRQFPLPNYTCKGGDAYE